MVAIAGPRLEAGRRANPFKSSRRTCGLKRRPSGPTQLPGKAARRENAISPAAFSAVFASNAAGLISSSQLSARLVTRTGPRPLLLVGLGVAAAGGLALVTVAVTGAPLPFLLAALFATMASIGFVGPNATALALQEHGEQAGTASALVGLGTFVTGALAAPLTGLVGGSGALPLAVVMAAFALAALAASLLTRPRRLALA